MQFYSLMAILNSYHSKNCKATIFLFLAIKYVNGNWQFKEKNKAAYIYWVEKNGNKMKKQIIIVAIVYYILMAFQILIYL